jgi:tetratricopeptide (TPR) repeat protein
MEILEAETGETVVVLRQAETFAEISGLVYGTAAEAGTLAALAGLSEDEPAPAGTVLVAPPREELDERRRRAERAQTEFEAGLAAAARREALSASEHFRTALRDAPSRDDIRYNLGIALLDAGFPAEALPPLQEVARRRPDHAESRYALGSALRRLRAYERAEVEFEAAVRLRPDDVAARYALARTRYDLGDPERARRDFREIVRRFPDDPLAASAEKWLASTEDGPPPSGPFPTP